MEVPTMQYSTVFPVDHRIVARRVKFVDNRVLGIGQCFIHWAEYLRDTSERIVRLDLPVEDRNIPVAVVVKFLLPVPYHLAPFEQIPHSLCYGRLPSVTFDGLQPVIEEIPVR